MRQAIVRAVRGSVLLGALVLTLPGVRVASASGRKATAVFAGGCYWGVESVFRHVKGVTSAVSGFAVAVDARPAPAPGRSDYVEAVRVEYDPSQVSYAQLLAIFFLVVHDPTERDRQGPDIGPEYRSVVFVADSAERQVVRGYIDHLANAHRYPGPIVTELSELKRFREANPDQQNYAATHEREPYIVINDLPKLAALKHQYPALYRD
jgi:peptide-methionine (S)-S-oxide reductase